MACLEKKQENPKQNVSLDHRVSNLLCMIQSRAADILNKTNDSQLKKEISKKNASTGGNIWDQLDQDLASIETYYDNYIPDSVQAPQYSKDHFIEASFSPPFQKPEFNAEEHEGKAIDSQILFQKYLNMTPLKDKGILFKDNLQFIRNFERIFDVGLDIKMKHFQKFLDFYSFIDNYLVNFFKKVQPLVDFESVQNQISSDFEKKKEQKTLKGYYEYQELNQDDNQEKEVEKKLYCKVCKIMFSNDNVYVHHFNGKKHKRNYNNLKKVVNEIEEDIDKIIEEKRKIKKEKLDKKKYKLARLEHRIGELKGLLIDVFENTLNFLRKKQTYNIDDISEENSIESDQELEISEEEEENYNPKNLPIGWDGKPIPYWLFKLHGLGIEFKCEICGNYSYWGRRAFEKHFTEWRHTYGMKCLRIPNSVHFREITSINDALILHRKLLVDSENNKFNPDKEEEFEDTDGNVLDKRTYLDLQKQGLL
jgi:splicing factor 3A subunit 3